MLNPRTMKTAQKMLVLVFVFASVASFGNAVEHKASIEVMTSKYNNLFVFKVGREFKGATIEVYYSNGDLVASQPLSKRKMIINFCDVKPGTYLIRVKKNSNVEEFT